jgi:hypothetical protein
MRMMRMRSALLLFPAMLLLAGCSKQTPTLSAQNQSPEPMERTPPPAASQPGIPASQPASQPPQGMYAQPVQPNAPAQPATPPVEPSGPAPAPAPAAPEPESQLQPAPAPPAYDGPIVPVGTPLRVRLDESLGTKHDRTGERFYATLASPVVVSGQTLIPVGTRFVGHLTESKPSGRLKGRAVLAVRLDGIERHGRVYRIETSSYVRVSKGRKRHDLKWMAGGGGAGAVIGAIAGGAGGAVVGAAAGVGAGAAGALASHRKQVGVAAETAITFRLRRPLQIS